MYLKIKNVFGRKVFPEFCRLGFKFQRNSDGLLFTDIEINFPCSVLTTLRIFYLVF